MRFSFGSCRWVEAPTIGDPLSESTNVRPLITGAATERVLGLIGAAREVRARVLAADGVESASVPPTMTLVAVAISGRHVRSRDEEVRPLFLLT